mmetsp:Transcript_30207/g.44428  ORF Transcript_30207/g.44428 Transcript_30207/m.44428 type:complete len:227 (+) Transcript_30207:1697-2377(+)
MAFVTPHFQEKQKVHEGNHVILRYDRTMVHHIVGNRPTHLLARTVRSNADIYFTSSSIFRALLYSLRFSWLSSFFHLASSSSASSPPATTAESSLASDAVASSLPPFSSLLFFSHSLYRKAFDVASSRILVLVESAAVDRYSSKRLNVPLLTILLLYICLINHDWSFLLNFHSVSSLPLFLSFQFCRYFAASLGSFVFVFFSFCLRFRRLVVFGAEFFSSPSSFNF